MASPTCSIGGRPIASPRPPSWIWWEASMRDGDLDPGFMLYLELNAAEAMAFAQMLKRLGYEDCARLADRKAVYGKRAEADVMWCAIQSVQYQFAQAGYAPR